MAGGKKYKKCLNRLFDVIINSSEFGILKDEADGKLFDIAHTRLEVRIDKSIMIDDSPATVALYEMMGGRACLFKNPANLREYLKKLSVLSLN